MKIIFLKYNHTKEKVMLVQLEKNLIIADHLTILNIRLLQINRYTWLDNQPGVNQSLVLEVP